MKISIAMATFNGEKYLKSQLDSIANQSLLPCELVIGDDGSTDGTLNVIEKFSLYAPFPVLVERNQKNLGFGENFLRTASRCSGDWIAFCDQDDIWLPHKIEAMFRVISRKDTDVIVSGTIFTDENMNILSYDPPLFPHKIIKSIHSPKLKIFPGHRMVFRKNILSQIPWEGRPFAHNGKRLVHDHYIGIIGMLSRRMIFLNEHLTFYRRHAGAETFDETLGWLARIRRARKSALFIYKNEMAIWQSLAIWFDDLLASGRYEGCEWLHLAGRKCRKLSNLYNIRIKIYSDANILSKIISLIIIFINGGVSKFGPHTIVKDVVEIFDSKMGGREFPPR